MSNDIHTCTATVIHILVYMFQVHILYKLPKYAPLFAHYLRQKWEGGILILFHTYASPAVPHTIVTTAVTLWMNGSFDERVLQEISGACVETKPRGIEATCIISGNRGRPRVKFALPV